MWLIFKLLYVSCMHRVLGMIFKGYVSRTTFFVKVQKKALAIVPNLIYNNLITSHFKTDYPLF